MGIPRGVYLDLCSLMSVYAHIRGCMSHFLGNIYLCTAGQHLPEAVAVYDTGGAIWRGHREALPAANTRPHAHAHPHPHTKKINKI